MLEKANVFWEDFWGSAETPASFLRAGSWSCASPMTVLRRSSAPRTALSTFLTRRRPIGTRRRTALTAAPASQTQAVTARDAEGDVLASADLIDRRDPIRAGGELTLPEHLAGLLIVGAYFVIGSGGGEDQAAQQVTTGPPRGSRAPVSLCPCCSNSRTPPLGTCHRIVPVFRS